MKTRFTPGPWVIKEHNHGNVRGAHGIYSANLGFLVNEVWGLDIPQSDANARLIAAAPELYAALQDAAEAFEALASGRDIVVINLDVYKHWQTILAAARGENS